MFNITKELYDIGTLPEVGVIPEKMHAWTIRRERLGEPLKAFKQEIVKTPLPRKGEILVANMAAGINYNGIWAASGKPKNVIDNNGNYDDEKEDFHICGSEASGIVYAVGEGVTRFKVGDKVAVGAAQYDPECPVIKSGGDPVMSPTFRVWGYEGNWGAFAQFCRVKEYQCNQMPKNYDWYDAACYTAAGAAVYRMLTHWKGNTVKPGDVVLIYGGTGGLGSMAIPLVRHFGGIPVAVVSSEEKGRICVEMGAEGYVNRTNFHHWGRLENYLDGNSQKKWIAEAQRFRKNVWKAAGLKKNPAIVIEHPGMDTMPTSVFVCDSEGMVVTCGATSSYLADFDLRFLWLSQKRIQGSHSATPEDYKEFVSIIESDNIKPYIGKVASWDELAAEHQLYSEGKGAPGRTVIKVGAK